MLRKQSAGFEGSELRRILVRACAVRTFRDDGSAWWRLLSRMDVYIEHRTRRAAAATGSQDAADPPR